MGDTLKTLVTSKRFLVITLACLILGAFVVTGKMSAQDFQGKLTALAGLLATLYGLENVSAAHGQGFPMPSAQSTSVTVGATSPPPALPVVSESEGSKS